MEIRGKLIITVICTIIWGFVYLIVVNRMPEQEQSKNALAQIQWDSSGIFSDDREPPKGTFYFGSPIIMADGKKIEIGRDQLYIDRNQNLMVSKELIRECFSCFAEFYENSRIEIEKNQHKLIWVAGSKEITVNGVPQLMDLTIVEKDGTCYVPLLSVAEMIGYDYILDEPQQTLYLTKKNKGEPELPESYDTRRREKAPFIRNQGNLGTCWAAAAASAIETVLLPERSFQLSVDHMSLSNSFMASQNDGGDYTMAMAYLSGWQGPVMESEDPYGDGYSPAGLGAAVHIQEIQAFRGKNYQEIKKAVYKYGAVQSSLHMALLRLNGQSEYYNRESYAYCYRGTKKPNHDILIIGWDDQYPASKFTGGVKNNGAFICQNSWGTEFGEQGIFYVSYEDSSIGLYSAAYSKVEDKDNYGFIYQSDLCGWRGQIGFGTETSFFANVYEAKREEEIKAAGFYAVDENTKYKLYYIKDFQDETSLKERVFVKEGEFSNAGFYTVTFNTPEALTKGQRFAVMVEIETSDSSYPVAVEYKTKDSEMVDLSDGEGYISLDGEHFISTEKVYDCNLCLKVYTGE